MIEYDTEAACFRPLPLGRAVFASSLLLEEALSIRVRGARECGPPFMGRVVLSCMLVAMLTVHLLVATRDPFTLQLPTAVVHSLAACQAEMASAMRQLDLTSDLQVRLLGHSRFDCDRAASCDAAAVQDGAPYPAVLPTAPVPLQPCFLAVSPYHLPDMTDRQWRKLFAEWSRAPVVCSHACLLAPLPPAAAMWVCTALLLHDAQALKTLEPGAQTCLALLPAMCRVSGMRCCAWRAAARRPVLRSASSTF